MATHKYGGMKLYTNVSYEHDLQLAFSKANKTIAFLKKFEPSLPRKSLVTIHISLRLW